MNYIILSDLIAGEVRTHGLFMYHLKTKIHYGSFFAHSKDTFYTIQVFFLFTSHEIIHP